MNPGKIERDVDRRRVRALNSVAPGHGPVVYAMTREQRTEDNWALLFAQQLARALHVPLIVAAHPVADWHHPTLRQLHFALAGLRHLEKPFRRLAMPFTVISGTPERAIGELLKAVRAAALVVDFSPLKPGRKWRAAVANSAGVPVHEVDAHNVVPCWQASTKQEYGAYTLRPKIRRALDSYLTEFPRPVRHPYHWADGFPGIDWDAPLRRKGLDRKAPPLERPYAGAREARHALDRFLRRGFAFYHTQRNDPNVKAQSGLSPYLHCGQIAPQRVALEIQRSDGRLESQSDYLEELIVRRELSDNFCLYNEQYDSLEGLPDWARATLDAHRHDPRPHLYSPDQMERGQTHDPLWNAAQLNMVATGRMHGYLRMYWAKKILEWSESPEVAMATAIRLNDRYPLDGNDPNGYAGIAWSIGGVHDRPWRERPIFGKIRYMSYDGCRRKFDVDHFVNTVRTPARRKVR